MKRTIATAIAGAAYLLSSMVHAETLYRGKGASGASAAWHVYQTTADRIIVAQRLTCSYGPWLSETLPTGATVLTRHKVCTNGR